jgi:16S rRNA (adenine1518-N6/adenine1519-N6)-dimethyltransferase
MTVTIQRELAGRLGAAPGGRDYGPVSVLVALLGKITPGTLLPPSAFWPAPKVHSQLVRIVFDAASAARVASIEALKTVLSVAFAQRRKQIRSVSRRWSGPGGSEAFNEALARSGIDPALRPEQVAPAGFAALANALQAILP